ncbi:16S rRNA processing protein [Serratia symbiotica str. 'Cinara cedri']|nr:16S rRNA processing protein [Serratia symbiotica str. 'Cinara cedri']
MVVMRRKIRLLAPPQAIVLGKIQFAYGIHGWIRMLSYTQNAESIFDYQPWLIQRMGQWNVVEYEDWKSYNQNFIIKIKGINDRNATSALTNCKIILDSRHLMQLEEGDYYWKDLIDCQVVTTTGYIMGKVIHMIETGSNDVMVIKANLKDVFGIKERLVPFLCDQVIKKVDLIAQVINVDWDPDF